MSKAVLIMDMPESCFGCNFMYCDEESDTETCQAMETARDIDLIEDRPDWCPLRELPEKMEVCGKYNSDYYAKGGKMPSYKIGWNDCLDEILKECDADGTH